MASRAECRSCGSRASETAFPTIHRRGDPWLCCDCAAEAARLVEPSRRRVITRASYRAALRVRRASLQGDLVDLVVVPP